MQAGGNAVDAAVATGFALAVVHPPAGNIGGGGFMLIRMADGKTHFLDFREKAPAAATADMYLDAQGNVIEAQHRLQSDRSAGIGRRDGHAERNYGKLTLKQVMAPAIKLARDGFSLAWKRPGSARLVPGEIPGIAAHLPAQWRLLQAGRDFPPARPGAHPGANLEEP